MVRNNMTLIRCPCRKCGLRQWIDPDSGQLEEHLLRRGFMLGFNEEPAANVGHEEEADIGREDEESPEHGVHHEEGEADEGDDDAGGDGGGDAESKQTPLTSALRDPHVQELLLKDTGNAKPEAKLAQMEVDGMTPLYPGCRPEDTRLSVTLECLEMKAEHKWTDSSFSDNMKSWHARLPKDNTLPTSIDEAKKVVCPLDLPHVKYHACINDCALFRNEYKDRTTCPVCGQGRYKRGNKKVPLKVVWYFPITPRLQRYFVDPKEAKLMQWHAEREKPADDPEKGKILTHPADASQWNALDIEFADEFGSEPRNIRLGMSTDGLNPFGNQSSTHSTWPVFVWPYNLPPGCAQSSVQDYPGYAYVSCQVNHGFKACVKCMDKTPHLQLPKAPGSCKTVFQGTRMWLRFDHPWRKRKDLFNGEEELGRAPRPRSGEEISELLENWEECPAPGKKRPRESPLLGVWKARSIFWDLPYWKVLHTPHSLDVMHITKNVTESLLGTLMNMPERTKDGPKARTDLKLLGLKKELQYPTDSDDDDDEQTETTQGRHKRAKKNEVVVLKPACFTLSEEELERFFECLLGVKVPHGYSGKISRYLDVAKKRFSGMKSHDCHVLMTQILPVAMRGIMDDHVRETLFGLCNFFDVISRKSIGVKQLNRLQEEIVEILCELEIYFPPAFFDIMVHLLVHVVDDIIHLGPTFLHNMMPFERLNGVIKGFVRNRARPDGSIAKGFLTYECISFCQNYLSTENEDVGLPTRKHVGRLAGFGHREGYRAMHVGIAGRHADFDRAHRVALQHIELVSPWVDKHKSLIEQKFIDLGWPRKTGDVTKEHNSTFTGWFKKRLLESPAPMPSTEEQKLIFSLSQGPGHNVRTYQSYDINGYRFYTEEKDKNSEYQNSGVTMLSYTDDKTDVKERFYGRIEEIWELDYVGVMMPMFRVRWAKSVEKDGLYFTTMVIPDAKSKTPSAKNEPWVLASQVDQCFFITDPSKPSRVVVRRGKRSIIGMEGEADKQDIDKNGDPKIEEEFDKYFDKPTTYSKRRTTAALASPAAAARARAALALARCCSPAALAAPLALLPPASRSRDAPAARARASSTTTKQEIANMSADDNVAGTSKAAMTLEEEARAANVEFWEFGPSQRQEEEEVDLAAEEVGADRQMTEAGEEEEYEPTTDGGDHTGGDGVGEADGSGNPAAKKKKKPRKDRKPTVLANTTSEITLVSESGQPQEPLDVAAGYGMQLGCIVRESMSINTVNLRGEGNEHLVELCLRKLHRRYTFPAPYNNLERSNPVNKLAITKMSNALSSWKSRVKAKIDKGESFESIKKGEPMLDEAEFQIFKERLESEDAKAWTEWGRQMHELNLGAHHLGSGGYRGKIPIWEKEDEELARAGKPNPWLKMTDLQVRYFVRARYTLDRTTMEFVTEHDDVRKFEEKLNEQLAAADLPEAESSSQGSTEPWDTPFNRALNIHKERPISKPPTSAGRVCGFGTSMKFREYYKEESSKKRRRSAMSSEDKAEVEELRKKVSMLEEKQANSMDKEEVDKLFEKKLRDFLPPQVIEGIAAWNAAGQVGPIKVPSAGASNSIFNASPSPDLVTPPPTIAAGQPMELDEPVPPAPAEATKAQPAAVVLHNAPEPQKIDRPAATVSTLAQLNAITKDTPCVLLHCAPGGELKDVATGMIIQPKSTTLHTVAMDANVLKVTLGRVLPGCEDMDPPIQPEGADEHLTLENCHGYTMPIVRPPARRAAPPVVTATTSRHKKLLGESLPQPPPAEPKGKAAAPLSPIPSPNEDDIDDDGPVDVDAYLNTGADIDDLYMAGADEEAYRARDEPAGPPKATKQRLVFRGFSQETPPAADTQEPTAANIFSPNTLIKKVNEQFEASGAVAPKKPRKRPSKNKEKSASQPPPTIRHRDSMVPPSKDGLTRMHEAGKPILGPELQHLASGDMLPLQDSILVLESILLKDKDPNYPVFTVRVPRDVGFVTDAPADIFFIAYEDIFKLFHSRRLDYNLVRLFALNLAMKIKRESTPDVAIADPYYMRESQLALSAVRVRASLYLQKCFLDNKRKDNILLAYFPEDTHCVLISIAPKYSLATYFDSGSAKKKNYARIRGVLDDALEGYFKKGGAFKEKAECFRDDGKHKFKHVFEFPCVKQPENSTLDAFYVMHHLKGFVRDSQNLLLPSALRGWAEKLARINDDDLREDFHDTKVKLSHIIIQDVTTGGGPLNQGRALCKRDIEHRLKAQGDTRTWITKDLYKPFPEPCEP
ncbi:hypothetical protein QYE76_039089 [Lolium multiflorum]|uniref:Transposon protein, putative, CACTA, En/Spm sub-class n=1 Tax=Lolium multiflorum TaxID=4521 RepID=A0AAD8WTJ3_LOLMU|nr:hypothetical protein QYE76_039089 [Lolium multiflorum]